MVVGNGMVANAFRQYENDDNVIIFASGVSNSKENNYSEFEREFKLLKSHITSKKKIIYFSTCSIFDESISSSRYIQHKKFIENFIQKHCHQYIIFRLPNVVGNTKNNNTSFNFFKNKITQGDEIQVQKQATRYIVDIDDIGELLPFFISNPNYKKETINVCFNNKISVQDLVMEMSRVLDKNAIIALCDGGTDYDVNNTEFIHSLEEQGYAFNYKYNSSIIEKYLRQ